MEEYKLGPLAQINMSLVPLFMVAVFFVKREKRRAFFVHLVAK